MLSLLLLTANNIDKATFNKDFILNIISQFNIFLPLVMAIPIIVTIVKSFIFDNDEDKKLNFSVIGRIVGTATILTLVPFISIVMTYVIKTQLI
jgi:hypothetical protein